MKNSMGSALLILGKLKKNKDGKMDEEGDSDTEESSHEDELHQVAEQLIQAVKDEDAEAVVNALHMAFSLCKEMSEQEEGTEEESEGDEEY